MPDSELIFKSAPELAALLKSRQVSPVEVVEACLDRIEEFDGRVHAFLTVTH